MRESKHTLLKISGPARTPGWQNTPIMAGALRISGAVIEGDGDEGCVSWHIRTDQPGWTTVALINHPRGPWREIDGRVRYALTRMAAEHADPVIGAHLIRDALGAHAEGAGLALARVDPLGLSAEVVNVSMSTVVHWDPHEGLSPYEPLTDSLANIPRHLSSDVIDLQPGAAFMQVTHGVLPRDAGWDELNDFVKAVGLDPLGGSLAEATPEELVRSLSDSWRGLGPGGFVVAGLPLSQALLA